MSGGALIAASLCVAASLPAATKAVRFRKLWDGTGRTIPNAVVVIENTRIKSVGSDPAAIPAGAQIIDLSRYTGLPGLIDVHTHMTYGPSPGGNRSTIVNMVLGQEALKKTLESGVTTVRDMNASDYVDIAMRDLIRMGTWSGPRMFVVGYGLRITRTPYRPGAAPAGGGVIDGPSEAMRAARQQIAAGADWVKVFGSTGSGQDVTGFQTLTYEEMKAAADATHALGKRIAIHSYGPGGARDAIRAGADSLEHATDMDHATIADLVRSKTFYVPTIDHNRYYLDHGREFNYATGYRERLSDFIQRNLETARRAFQAGAKIAMGSDAIFSMFGENTRELGWFVKAGMTPEQALLTATRNAAELLGMTGSIGAAAPGYFADMIAVEGDPLSDITVLFSSVRWVMKDGAVVVDATGTRSGAGDRN